MKLIFEDPYSGIEASENLYVNSKGEVIEVLDTVEPEYKRREDLGAILMWERADAD